MRFDQLKEKALSLPYAPGVYIMKDSEDTVIYVGKAKKLKNRVSQYFQDTAAHSPKTKAMVSKIHHFDVIIARSEFEALVLECSLIKRHQPKYNILLKDGKGYPYLRLDMREDYPTITMVNRISDDGAGYYGPFGSRGVTNTILEAVRLALRLPGCKRKFPQDIGKGRLCLHYHMAQCDGWCQNVNGQKAYRFAAEQARQLLMGNYKNVSQKIRTQMLDASENLNFELAAKLRDQLAAVESLGQKQLVTAGVMADTDVIGYAQTETKACFTVLHYVGGNLIDKDFEIFSLPETPEMAVSSLMKQYYLSRGFAPRIIMLPFVVEDGELFAQFLEQEYGRKVHIKVPQRGDNLRMVDFAANNAQEEAARATDREERAGATLELLGKMLGVQTPRRIESFDISNLSGTDIVASMVVFCDGKSKRSEYKRFKINELDGQDDYASMRQVVMRRFHHYMKADKGFDAAPDLLLIDGGMTHANVAAEVLQNLDLHIPVFGMVKDDRHRTRALVTANGEEIRIDTQQAVFSLIGNIQEETHRFAINYHRSLRSKRLRYSELDAIPGIGPKRKELLLKAFKSIKEIKEAELEALLRHLPADAANAVYSHFHREQR